MLVPAPLPRLRPVALPGGWPRQALLFLAAYLAYGASRWVVTGDEATAIAHAHRIVDVERAIGLAVEAPVQRALDGGALMWVLNHAYLAAQVVVVPAVLTWLYVRDRRSFAVSVVLARRARRPLGKLAATLWAPTIFVAVVATGNHFVLDIVAGVAVTLAGFAVARVLHRRRLGSATP